MFFAVDKFEELIFEGEEFGEIVLVGDVGIRDRDRLSSFPFPVCCRSRLLLFTGEVEVADGFEGG